MLSAMVAKEALHKAIQNSNQSHIGISKCNNLQDNIETNELKQKCFRCY